MTTKEDGLPTSRVQNNNHIHVHNNFNFSLNLGDSLNIFALAAGIIFLKRITQKKKKSTSTNIHTANKVQ